MSWWSGLTSSGSGNSNIWGAVISGVSSLASGYLGSKSKDKDNAAAMLMSKEQIEAQGYQSRLNSQFEADLVDYYKQKDKERDRVALNQYGRYNLMDKLMPTNSPAVQVPQKPTVPTGGLSG